MEFFQNGVSEGEDNVVLNKEQIKSILPHREPMLLIDEVESQNETSAVGYWHLSGDEDFFQGHFPDYPVVPGVYLLESMAQLIGVVMLQKEQYQGKLALFGGANKVKFRRQVRPRDICKIEIEITKLKGPAGMGEGKITVNGELACQAEMTFMAVDKE